SVSPGLSRALVAGGLDRGRLRQVCNAVDTRRFRPADAAERAALRRTLDLSPDRQVVLFVGYFSRDKRPDALFDGWGALPAAIVERSMMVFVGATRAEHAEIDAQLAERIRTAARERGLEPRIRFVESTLQIEDYYRAADLYVLPS